MTYLLIVYVALTGQQPAIYELSGPWSLSTCAAKVQEVTQRASREYPNGQVTGQCVQFFKG